MLRPHPERSTAAAYGLVLTTALPSRQAGELLAFVEVRQAVGIELAEAERACPALLETNHKGVIALARRLFERRRLGGTEVADLLAARRATTGDESLLQGFVVGALAGHGSHFESLGTVAEDVADRRGDP